MHRIDDKTFDFLVSTRQCEGQKSIGIFDFFQTALFKIPLLKVMPFPISTLQFLRICSRIWCNFVSAGRMNQQPIVDVLPIYIERAPQSASSLWAAE